MPLVGAIRALVLLDVVGSGGRDLHALPVVPLLAVIAADPELVLAVIVSAGSAQHSTAQGVVLPCSSASSSSTSSPLSSSSPSKNQAYSHRFKKPEVSHLSRFPDLTGNSSRPKKAAYSDEHSPSTRRNTDGDGVQEREAEISMVTRTLVMTATAADLERSVGVDRANRPVV